MRTSKAMAAFSASGAYTFLYAAEGLVSKYCPSLVEAMTWWQGHGRGGDGGGKRLTYIA